MRCRGKAQQTMQQTQRGHPNTHITEAAEETLTERRLRRAAGGHVWRVKEAAPPRRFEPEHLLCEPSEPRASRVCEPGVLGLR